MSYTFNCDNKIIQLLNTSTLDMQDLYSRWKDEVLSTIAGCDQVFRVIKEPLAGSTFVGPFYFLMNNWQIRPVDIAHELVISGTLVQDATSTENVLKLDDLTSVVSVTREVAVEVQTVETNASGLTDQEALTLLNIPRIIARNKEL